MDGSILIVTKEIDAFTFIYSLHQEKETLANRQTIFNEVQKFLKASNFFANLTVDTKKNSLSVTTDNFYFACDTKQHLTFGFTCSEDTIPKLNSVINDIVNELLKHNSGSKIACTKITCGVEYLLASDTADFFAQILSEKLSPFCKSCGIFLPNEITLEGVPVGKDATRWGFTFRVTEAEVETTDPQKDDEETSETDETEAEYENRYILTARVNKTQPLSKDVPLTTLRLIEKTTNKLVKDLW